MSSQKVTVLLPSVSHMYLSKCAELQTVKLNIRLSKPSAFFIFTEPNACAIILIKYSIL